MIARYYKHILEFKRPSGTSRGILHSKETWFIVLIDDDRTGIGECGLLRGLSVDDRPDYEAKLAWVCANIHLGKASLLADLTEFPSIQMGLECAYLSMNSGNIFSLFSNEFSNGQAQIPINGLIWMGDDQFMLDQVEQKLSEGFSCIKMKVGAIAFEKELSILKSIRKRYAKDEMVLRVDANGAFGEDALEKLTQLADLDIHSIEQPLPKGHGQEMRKLCQASPLPIALDEELIGVFTKEERIAVLEEIQPQYIILKPSFIGGFSGAEQWLKLAKARGIAAWVTSALESNIGLNAIAQWTYDHQFEGHQGLGTGGLFTNNFPSPMVIKNGYLSIDKTLQWKGLDPLVS